MSEVPQGPGWWQASDGLWYPPQQPPQQLLPPPIPTAPAPPSYQVPVGQPPHGAYPVAYPVAYQQPALSLPPLVCPACGGVVVGTASMCPRCGTMLGTPKDKTVAILLAVFLAPWTWCYTYTRDAAKFWIGISCFVVGLILTVVAIGFFMIFGIWLWAVIDAASRPDSYYRQFPNGQG